MVNRDTFNPGQVYVLSLMEKESLAGFLKSDLHSALKTRIANGEMEALVKEDSEDVKDGMSKEVRIQRYAAQGICTRAKGASMRTGQE